PITGNANTHDLSRPQRRPLYHPMKSAVTYYAQTMPGFEEIAWLEIRDRFPGATFGEYLYAKDQNGIIVFDYEGDMADLLQLRTTEDVFLLALNQPRMSRGKGDLARIVDLVGRSESFGRAANALLRWRKFSKPPTYRVISRKYGQHPYRRKDMETAVYRGLEARYPRWRAVEDGGQVEVWANMLGSQLLVGLRLSDRTMRHRYVKKVELPASLRPSMAAAMVHLTDPSPDDVFLDPMCGSGTILLERLHAGPYQNILGGDISQESVEATRLNLPQRRKGRKQQQISLRQEQDLEELYDGLFTELARVVVPEGRIVLLSSEYDLIKQLMRRHPHLEILSGYSVATKGVWGRIYLIRRVP
ncbi:MAG: hypothetical protein P8169_16155, partial [Chloroflexota bacterium]